MIRRGMAVVVAALVMWPSAQLPAQDSAKTMLQVGRKQENRAVGKTGEARAQELSKALDIYRQVPERWPTANAESATARLRMGEIHKKLKDPEKALRELEGALAVAGESTVHVKALAVKASILRQQKDLEGAKAALKRIVDEYPTHERPAARACLALGSVAKQQKRWHEARTWGERVLEKHASLWRENVDACNLVVSVLVRCRQWVDAIAKLKELDQFLEERFSDHEKWASVRQAMDHMPARRSVTPIPLED